MACDENSRKMSRINLTARCMLKEREKKAIRSDRYRLLRQSAVKNTIFLLRYQATSKKKHSYSSVDEIAWKLTSRRE